LAKFLSSSLNDETPDSMADQLTVLLK